MIHNIKNENIIASVNIEVTDYYTICDEIIEYIENAPDIIKVNSMYFYQKHYKDTYGFYIYRSSFDFRFWFSDINSAKRFTDKFSGILEIPPVLPK